MKTENDPVSAQESAEPEKRQLTPAARYALSALLVLVVGFNVWFMFKRMEPSPPPDTTAQLRTAGGAIPVYAGPEGDGRLHLLKPGATVALGDVHRLPGPRYPVHVTLEEDTVIEGMIDGKDLAPGELDRVKMILEKSKR